MYQNFRNLVLKERMGCRLLLDFFVAELNLVGACYEGVTGTKATKNPGSWEAPRIVRYPIYGGLRHGFGPKGLQYRSPPVQL